jgi:heme/copper-type cytochrome/quinol oxidase subunit 4
MPLLVLCLVALATLVSLKLDGAIALSWWVVLLPAPAYLVIQVLLGLAYWLYMASRWERS